MTGKLKDDKRPKIVFDYVKMKNNHITGAFVLSGSFNKIKF